MSASGPRSTVWRGKGAIRFTADHGLRKAKQGELDFGWNVDMASMLRCNYEGEKMDCFVL